MHSPIYSYPKIFAVLVDWYHHIVLTLSFKLVSFLHICQVKTDHFFIDKNVLALYFLNVCYIQWCRSRGERGMEHIAPNKKYQERNVSPCQFSFTWNFGRLMCHPLDIFVWIDATGDVYGVQGRRSLWDRGDTSPQYLDRGDIITNVPPPIFLE